MGGNRGEPSSPRPGHTCSYAINQAQSFDRTARGMRVAGEWGSGVAGETALAARRGCRAGSPTYECVGKSILG